MKSDNSIRWHLPTVYRGRPFRKFKVGWLGNVSSYFQIQTQYTFKKFTSDKIIKNIGVLDYITDKVSSVNILIYPKLTYIYLFPPFFSSFLSPFPPSSLFSFLLSFLPFSLSPILLCYKFKEFIFGNKVCYISNGSFYTLWHCDIKVPSTSLYSQFSLIYHITVEITRK